MSYGITPFRVDVAFIRKLFGSRDDKAQQELLQAFALRLDEFDEIFDAMPLARTALADYFAGEINHPESGSLYWYIVEILCEHYGTFMNNNEWYPASDKPLWEMNSLSLRGIEELPYPMDFPVVRVALRKSFDEVLSEAEEHIVDEGMKDQFIYWIEQARAHQQDVVLYYD